HRAAAVAGPIVDDEDFGEIGAGLKQRREARFQGAGAVMDRDDDRNPWFRPGRPPVRFGRHFRAEVTKNPEKWAVFSVLPGRLFQRVYQERRVTVTCPRPARLVRAWSRWHQPAPWTPPGARCRCRSRHACDGDGSRSA